MDTRIILFFIIVLFSLLLGGGKDVYRHKQKWYIIILITLLILESGLRSVLVGPDTYNYYNDFLSIKDMNWSQVWTSFYASYQQGEGKDPGFTLFVKLIQLFSADFNFFLIVAALLFFIPLGLILYRYSTHLIQLVFAFTLYVALFHIVALSGIRQQIATGITFMAFLQLGRDHFARGILFIMLASLIHISALFFLLVPLLSLLHLKYLKPIHFVSFFIIPFVILYARSIMAFLASFLANEYYTLYASGESTNGAFLYVLLMELLSLFCFVAIKYDKLKHDICISQLYVALPLLTLTVPLISLNGAMIRIGQYFTLYMMLLAPIAIDSFIRKNSRTVIYWVMVSALIYLGITSSSFHYSFFWQ